MGFGVRCDAGKEAVMSYDCGPPFENDENLAVTVFYVYLK